MLRSNSESWYYVGISSNVEKRLTQHNTGNVRSTKARRPYTLVYIECYSSKTNARKRELEIKRNWRIKKSIINSIETALSSNG